MNYAAQPYQPQYNPNLAQQPWQYQRMAELEQRLPQQYQYPQYQQPQQMAQPYPCMPVTSVDEVKAMQVDFTGKPSFFFNASANEVYIKQLNMDTGASQVKTYSLTQPEAPTAAPIVSQSKEPAKADYVARGEFEALQDKVNQLIGGTKNESTANDEQSNVAASPTDGKRKVAGASKSSDS